MGYSANTHILSIDPQQPQPEAIQTAADVLRRGGLVAFPTETVYGLGANAFDAAALERIYLAKHRPSNDPLIVHIHDLRQLDLLAVNVPAGAYALAERFWPGPLTMVLQRAANVPATVAQGLNTIAIRMPVHPTAVALLKVCSFPIAAPSANTFTRPSATSAAHVLEDLRGHVDLVLDGGPTPIGLESTVVDLTDHPARILRPGGILLDDLKAVLPDIMMAAPPVNSSSDAQDSYAHQQHVQYEATAAAASPGMMMKHYSPRAQVMLFDGRPETVMVAIADTAQRLAANGKRVGILATEEDAPYFTDVGARIISLGSQNDLEQIGRLLFGGMRALDGQKVDVILVHGFGHEGLGATIWDRLLRAAEGKVIHLD
jgi:L-threonylcarbamoyladenylate synthase